MIEIHDVFVCDSVCEGQFSKIDIIGLNGTGIIGISNLPYKLITNFVIKGFANSDIPKLSLIVKYYNSSFKEVVNSTIVVTEAINNEKEVGLFFPIQTTFNIEDYGSLSLDVVSDNQKFLTRKYRVIKLNSPNLRNINHSKPVVLVDNKHGLTDNLIEVIISRANKSLKVVDNYIAPIDLLKLLSLAKQDIEIKVITSMRQKAIFNKEIAKLSAYSKLNVKFCNSFHDRFLILNDTEFYHSGHSFKDIMAGKISMLSKVTGLEETDKILGLFDSEWKKGDSL